MKAQLRQAAQQELARRELMRFARYVEPSYQNAAHLYLITAHLERLWRREITRLMIFAPPRHGKSKLTSELFPAFALGNDPNEQIILCTHSQELSDTFSRNVRNLIADDRYHELFPETQLSLDSATVQKWTLRDHTRPAMISVGTGGSPTGHGARILIIDDPIGSAGDAESQLQRENLYRWYILMMQRWHEDDLAGRLLRDQSRADQWTVLNLPALAEKDDTLQRSVGEALWPERFPVDVLEQIRAVNTRAFEAKYQQRPRPAEGSLFKRNWFRIVDAAPDGLTWMRYYDLAYSQRQQADNTATIAGGLGTDGTLYLRRGRAGKMESPEQHKMIKSLMLNEPDTRHGIEKAIHGGPLVQELRRDRELMKISFVAVDIAMNQPDRKYVLARPVADRAEAGKVAFVRETVNDDGWIEDWIDELCSFPFGAHDDRVDCVSGVNAMLGQRSSTAAGSSRVTRLDSFGS
jgi:predicted phage terminase large subunit-like protein